MQRVLILTFIPIIAIVLLGALVHYIGVQGFLFAWILNFMLMACVLAFTETLKSPLTSPYYNDKAWEHRGKIYESFGVNFFRKLLRWVGWEKLNKKSNPIEKNTKTLMQLHYRTKQSELGHSIIFGIVLGFTIFVAVKFGVFKSVWLFILNILLNLYPILLQRYNRPRIERAIVLSKRN
ncbi:glycosyl-4,4'-diaponeurosporenoate acyltransferase CrtO family protein [Xanthocytophaga flava]|uniref:glycosyl-4,4'-diaponeurosporenoate acyltransferase CrtO family protein n=1 Tax=Xanthocytophaga flava TaxID=3048013 RepID=UPI0028D48415|nr:hypothetical protein [Xanthocytophaga flavus]MDJ1469240.1 hypothetical protein [Xanthocytophaga flavus]